MTATSPEVGARSADPLRVAVVGTGYWGPNLIRNFQASPAWELAWVCDLDKRRAAAAVGRYSTVPLTTSIDDVIGDDSVDAIAVATPAATHCAITTAALHAAKHALVEKPLACTVAEAQEMIELAEERRVTLMCDHTYCYTPAVQKIRDLVASGTVGEILYVDSVRINLGLLQRDIDVFWDLAPHDLSILDFVLPEDSSPTAVAAYGADPLGTGMSCIGYLTLQLGSKGLAHVHVNWLSPTKIRTMVVGGSRRTLVWDDLNPSQRLSMFDRGVDIAGVDIPEVDEQQRRREILVSYRLGEMIAPALPEVEALSVTVSEFASAIRGRRRPKTDGLSGLRVLKVLEAARRSLCEGGRLVQLA